MICRNVHRSAAVQRPGLAVISGTKRKTGISTMLAAFWLCAAGALAAQTVTTLFSFDDTNGELPTGALVQATDGNFYGATIQGGANLRLCRRSARRH
jgi:hypothetical protein